MLAPEQVKPFLLHDDLGVREQAVRYFDDGPPGEVLTADDLWAVIDRFPRETSWPFYNRLPGVRQTPASIERALDALASDPSHHVQRVLAEAVDEADVELLRAQRDVILNHPAAPQRVRDNVVTRLELAGRPPQALWDEYVTLAGQIDEEKDERDVEGADARSRRLDLLLDALARDGGAVADKAMAVLSDESLDDWRPYYAALYLTRVGHAPAADLLIDGLVDEMDAMHEAAVRGLANLPAEVVIPRLTARLDVEDEGFAISASAVLGNFRRPEAEAALIDMLDLDLDTDTRTAVMGALGDLCTTDPKALAAIGDALRRHDYDPQVAELEAMMVALCTMLGQSPRELPRWRQSAAAARAKRVQRFDAADPAAWDRMEKDDELSLLQMAEELGIDTARAGSFDDDDDDDYAPALPASIDPYVEPTMPITRDAPKVGRNDPCPCGSGKKYKKCCGG